MVDGAIGAPWTIEERLRSGVSSVKHLERGGEMPAHALLGEIGVSCRDRLDDTLVGLMSLGGDRGQVASVLRRRRDVTADELGHHANEQSERATPADLGDLMVHVVEMDRIVPTLALDLDRVDQALAERGRDGLCGHPHRGDLERGTHVDELLRRDPIVLERETGSAHDGRAVGSGNHQSPTRPLSLIHI